MALPAGGEPKLGVIPRVVKYGFGGIREYSILLTDRRFIFVLASLNRMFLVAAAIGGAIGAAIAAPAARDATGESESYIFKDDPDTLASMPDSLVIRYDGLRRLLLKRYPADYELVIDFLDEAGKKDRLRLQLKPPDNVEASARAAGVSGKTVMKNYAAETQASILRALPQTIATRAEWKF